MINPELTNAINEQIGREFGAIRKRLTKRALDAGDSAAFSSIFLASSFSCSEAESMPAPAPVTQTVGWLRIKRKRK